MHEDRNVIVVMHAIILRTVFVFIANHFVAISGKGLNKTFKFDSNSINFEQLKKEKAL
jgi:hypothetical protein